MKNIISNLVMLIDMYYYRKRIMIRWRSIKHYQRVGKIKPKVTKVKYPNYQTPISPNPPRPRSASILSKKFKELLKQRGVQASISGFEATRALKIDITYKNMNRILQFTDHAFGPQIEEVVYRALDEIDYEIIRSRTF